MIPLSVLNVVALVLVAVALAMIEPRPAPTLAPIPVIEEDENNGPEPVRNKGPPVLGATETP